MRTVTATCAFAALALLPFASAQEKLLPSSAAAYAGYQGEVSSMNKQAPLKGAEDLDSALNTFGAQNADQLSSGWVSYQAMIAAQNKEFADAVKDIDGYYGRERVVTGMKNDPAYARTLKGGEKALQTTLAVNSRDASRISSAAAFVKDQAYKLQDIAWGKTRLKSPGATATQLKVNAKSVKPVADAAKKFFAAPELNLAIADASSGQGQSIWDKVGLLTASAAPSAVGAIQAPVNNATALKVDPRYEGTANRIVTLAAFHVLEAEATNKEDVTGAMRDKTTHDCIDWSQLQLQACVSAAYTRSDLSFCLAEHAIKDPGLCFSRVAK